MKKKSKSFKHPVDLLNGIDKTNPCIPIRHRKVTRIEGKGIKKLHDHLSDPMVALTRKLDLITHQLRQEISGRKAVETELRKAVKLVEEERTKAETVNSVLGDGVMMQDTTFRIVYQNKIHSDFFGDHIGNYCYSACCGSEKVISDCPFDGSFADCLKHKIQKTVLTKTGEVNIEIAATPLRNADGDIIGGIEIVRDVTAFKHMERQLKEQSDHLDFMVKDRTAELRKVNKDLRAEIMRRIQMEKDLIESQRFVHRITNATPNILYLYDVAERRIIYINPRIRDILGYSADEVKSLGNAFFEKVLHPDDALVFESLKDRLNNAGEGDIIETEYRMMNHKGEWRWFYSRDVMFKRTGDDHLKLVLGISQDITERKKAEEELKNSREQLRLLLARLRSVREEESRRISREIHDELGQSLTALKMDLAWIMKRLNKDEHQVHEKTISMLHLIDMNIMTVKRISAELRPGLLDNLGLSAALEWQAEEFQNRTGIMCKIHMDPEDMVLDPELSTAIFRIFQETLTNIARHSRAQNVVVSLKDAKGEILLQVSDDGKGISERQISSPKSIGLIGMKERAHFLGGKVTIRGIKDKGTIVNVSLPVR